MSPVFTALMIPYMLAMLQKVLLWFASGVMERCGLAITAGPHRVLRFE